MSQDVPFNFAGAADLAAELRSVARVLDDQSGQRPGLATRAREEWRGRYGDQFEQRIGVCITDGRTLAAALRRAAAELDALAASARREQQRREAAQESQRPI